VSTQTRRLFLKRAARLAVLASAGRSFAASATATAPDPANLPQLTTIPSGGPVPDAAKSIVVDNRNAMIVAAGRLHEGALLNLIESGVRLATSEATSAGAWRKLFKTDDVIGIKFDDVGREKLNTTETFASQLVASLQQAGFERQRIVLIDVPKSLTKQLDTRPQIYGWQKNETSFTSGSERLAAVLDQVTALINVPLLKTDNISGIAGALRNISLPFVRRQARYFAHGSSPFIADIVALPQIRSKLRIHIVNGLRAVFDRGPDVQIDCVWPHGGILVSTDPVAVDSVSLEIINARRAQSQLPPLGNAKGRLPHIHAAALRGLGTDDQDYIRLLAPNHS
jgi:hypothetical protein